jgi:hypothetical protein
MEEQYARVTIEECDGVTNSIHSLRWLQELNQERPSIGEVAEALFEDHGIILPREKAEA